MDMRQDKRRQDVVAKSAWEYESVSGWLPIPSATTEAEAKAWYRRRWNVGKVRDGRVRKVQS